MPAWCFISGHETSLYNECSGSLAQDGETGNLSGGSTHAQFMN